MKTLSLGLVGCMYVAGAAANMSEKEALLAIRETANEICAAPVAEGSSLKVEGSTEARASLLKLLKKIGSLDVSAQVAGQHSSYTGLLQSDLAGVVLGTQDCKVKVLNILADRLLPKKAIPPALKKNSTSTKPSPTNQEALKWIPPKRSAAQFATDWITLLDRREYSYAYEQLTPDQKNARTISEFATAIKSIREASGAVVNRTVRSANVVPQQPTARPNEKLFLVAYATNWEHSSNVRGHPGDEVAFLQLNPQGEWQIAGYHCENCKQ
jgi:hypothetical protein